MRGIDEIGRKCVKVGGRANVLTLASVAVPVAAVRIEARPSIGNCTGPKRGKVMVFIAQFCAAAVAA